MLVVRDMKPSIIFEDNHLIVLDKPAGLLSQGEHTGDENLVDWLRSYLGRHYVGLIHRLDRNTSGIMVVAKRSKAAGRLTESLQKGELDRTYLGWLEGQISEPQTWAHELLKDEAKNQVRVVSSGTPGAKASVLKVFPQQRLFLETDPVTLARFELETGRSHQIRVQAAAAGLPLLGDPKYGSSSPLSRRFSRPLLHSHEVCFPHPISKESLRFQAGLPEDMRLS